MTAIIRPRPWATQPQIATSIDRSHWAGECLIDGFMGYASRTFSGKTIDKYSTSQNANSAGVGIKSGPSESGFVAPFNLSDINAITIVFQYVQHSRSGAQVLFEHSSNQNTNAGSFILYSDVTSGKLIYGTSAYNLYDSRSVPLPALGAVVTAVLRLRFSASVDSEQDVCVFINGSKPVSLNVASTAAAINFGNYSTCFLWRGGASLHAQATVNAYYVLSGFLSDSECASLSTNPYQIFTPRVT